MVRIFSIHEMQGYINFVGDERFVSLDSFQWLEAENQKLREQRDAANAQIQMLNSIIAGDVE